MFTTSPHLAVFTFLFFFLLLGTQTLGAPLSTSDSTDITDISECLDLTDTTSCIPEELRKRGNDNSEPLFAITSKREEYEEDDTTKTPDIKKTNYTTTTTTSPTPTPTPSTSDASWMLGHSGLTLVLAMVAAMFMVV